MDDDVKQNMPRGSAGNPFTKSSDEGDGNAGPECVAGMELQSKLRRQEQQEQDERALQHRLRIMEADFELYIKKRKREAEIEKEKMEADFELYIKKRKREAEIDEETQERREKAAEEKDMKKKLAKEQALKEVKEAEDARLQAVEVAGNIEKAKKFQTTMKQILNGTMWQMHECKPLQEGFLTAYLDYHKLEYSSDERDLYNHICPAAMNIMIQSYNGRVKNEPIALAFALQTYPPAEATSSDRVEFYVSGYLALLRTFSDPFMIGK